MSWFYQDFYKNYNTDVIYLDISQWRAVRLSYFSSRDSVHRNKFHDFIQISPKNYNTDVFYLAIPQSKSRQCDLADIIVWHVLRLSYLSSRDHNKCYQDFLQIFSHQCIWLGPIWNVKSKVPRVISLQELKSKITFDQISTTNALEVVNRISTNIRTLMHLTLSLICSSKVKSAKSHFNKIQKPTTFDQIS